MGIGGPDKTAVEFDGDWKNFIPIALTNSFLNIVTLGFYRFWATTRERKFFWSHTRVIDDQLEWTGTGLELFIGFIVALLVLGVPLIILNLVAQGAILQGVPVVAGILGVAIYVLLLAVIGLAIFRGLRYRLSRTYWHGINGGSDNPGFTYSLSYFWKTIVGILTLGLLIPWASTSLWKERWEQMSFGPHSFVSNPRWQVVMKRFLLCFLLPIGIVVALGAIAAVSAQGGDGGIAAGVAVGVGGLLVYIALPLLALIYYAAYTREVVSSLSLSKLEFEFTARSLDWLLLFLGNLGLSILAFFVGLIAASIFGGLGTLGALATSGPEALQAGIIAPTAVVLMFIAFIIPFMLVGPFVRLRTWAFFIRHFEIGGEVNLDELTQSTTKELTQGEGLLDAFDMGAI
jgi:uncharacterized membrane protein YjgN (DUF898 family)